jgi:DNA primase
MLYGVDLAKRDIARERRAVVVEGYTDVMACHLSGVGTAIATCGTAFGGEHARVLRRLLGDDRSLGAGGAVGGQVVFTFDGDEAGRKAALRAFEDDQRFVAQTFVAVAEGGMDPCELRQRRGPEAVRRLVESRQPLFEFAIRSTIAQVDLDTAEGRVHALRAAAPVVARIKDPALRPEYARRLAGWLGMEVETVTRAVARSAQQPASAPTGSSAARERPAGGSEHVAPLVPDPRDPVARVEREALECLLQVPLLVPSEVAEGLDESTFEVPAYRAVHHAIRAAGGISRARTLTGTAWAEAVREEAPSALAPLVTQLAVTPLPADTDDALARYAASVVLRLAEVEVSRRVGVMRSRVQRLDPSDPAAGEAFAELLAVESQRRALRERIAGG